jgi:hypothetical protein
MQDPHSPPFRGTTYVPGSTVTRPLLDRYSTVTRPLLDRYSTVTRPLRDRYATVTRPLRDRHATVTHLFHVSRIDICLGLGHGYVISHRDICLCLCDIRHRYLPTYRAICMPRANSRSRQVACMVGVEGIFPHLKARAASPPGRARRSMQNGSHARKRLPGRG